MNKKTIVTVLLAGGLLPAAAQPLGLDSLLTRLRQNNPALKVYDAGMRSLDEAAKGVRSWEPPELGTGLWMVPYNPSYWKKNADGSPGMGQYQVSFQQTLPVKKRWDAEEKYLKSLSLAEAERRNAAYNELAAQAKTNYYQWLISNKKLAVLDQDERLLNYMLKSAELRYKNGLGRINAYYKVQAALGTIQKRRIELENDIRQRRIALNTLLNRDKEQAFDIDSSYTIKDYSATALDTVALTHARSDIRAVEKDILNSYLQQDAERAKLKPEFGIRYDHMFGFGGLPMQYSLMGMVRIPMAGWSSRASKANVESLRWKTAALQWQKQAMLNEAAGKAYGLQNDLETKKKQLRLFEATIIPALRKNFQSMQLAYEQNTEELFALFDAWETLNMTQLEYFQQLQDILTLQAELEKILEIS